MTMFKKACRKNWTLGVWSGRLDSRLLDYGPLDTWTLEEGTIGLSTTERLGSGLLDSGQFYAWALDS